MHERTHVCTADVLKAESGLAQQLRGRRKPLQGVLACLESCMLAAIAQLESSACAGSGSGMAWVLFPSQDLSRLLCAQGREAISPEPQHKGQEAAGAPAGARAGHGFDDIPLWPLMCSSALSQLRPEQLAMHAQGRDATRNLNRSIRAKKLLERLPAHVQDMALRTFLWGLWWSAMLSRSLDLSSLQCTQREDTRRAT